MMVSSSFIFLIVLFSVSIYVTSSHERVTSHEYQLLEGTTSSNFGNKEFECVGTCFCDEARKTSSQVISRSLSYLLVSVSTILAYEKAKTYFDSKCQKELSDQCHQSSSIKSSVEECSSLVNKEKDNFEEENIEKRNDEERRVYFCYGNCLYSLRIKKESTKKQFSHMNCEKMKKEEEIIIYESNVIAKKGRYSDNFRLTAVNKFTRLLTEFCKENSRMEYTWEGTRKSLSKSLSEKRVFFPLIIKKRGYGCVGNVRMGNNVHCIQIDPKSTTLNWKWRLDKFNKAKKEWDLI